MTPQVQSLVGYMEKNGSVSAREALIDLDMTSATLARRICDLEERGTVIRRERSKHPVTGKRYTRYSLGDTEVLPV